jgi:hypothetical protein
MSSYLLLSLIIHDFVRYKTNERKVRMCHMCGWKWLTACKNGASGSLKGTTVELFAIQSNLSSLGQ